MLAKKTNKDIGFFVPSNIKESSLVSIFKLTIKYIISNIELVKKGQRFAHNAFLFFFFPIKYINRAMIVKIVIETGTNINAKKIVSIV